MMNKQVTFLGKTESGIFCRSLFGAAGAFEKVAGAPAFADWETGDQLRKYIRTITPDMRKKYSYVLVNALGAGEYFGSNINADYFPWNSLAHEGDDYGYKTFYRAHAFQHHRNKDPLRAFGVPVLSVLNVSMKRVELIIQLDREKAKLEGADGIITRVDAGEFPDVSMGCKVPFDVCSICGHRSKTRADYCEHMSPPEGFRGIYGPNKILADGRKIYVINLTPRFFDISFVFIGADKTAKVMAKLASKGRQLCLGDVCTLSAASPLLYGPDGNPIQKDEEPSVVKTASASHCETGSCCNECGMDKLASIFEVKTAERKLAEIVKNIPAGAFAMKQLPAIEKMEPDLPKDILDGMSEVPLSGMLAGTAGLGVVLKPHEFQRVVLKRMGQDDLADRLDDQGQVFRQVPEFANTALAPNLEDNVRSVLPLLKEYIGSRTAFGKPFRMRMILIKEGGRNFPLPTRSTIAHPLLDKISAAYNGYRRELMLKLSQATGVVQSDPKLREAILGDDLVNQFSKTSSAAPVADLNTVAYVMGAHLSDRSLLCTTAVAEAVAVYNEELLSEELSA